MPTKEQGRAKVEELVQGFRANLRELRDAQTKEAVIRQQFIDRFWKALGWDVDNSAQKPAGEKDVEIEAGVGTIEDRRFSHRRCDYIFRAGGLRRFLLEAKKPAVSVDDSDAVFQAKTYAWNDQVPFAVLSNFEGFRLFDATAEPSKAHPGRGLIQDFKLGFEDYVNQWDALWATFSREAVEGGSLERLFLKIKGQRAGRRVRTSDRMLFEMRGSAPVDRVFLEHLQAWRERFAKALFRENQSAFPDAETRHGAANLTEAAQRLIDRLVFIRVCEDRDIMEYGRLKQLLEDCRPDELYPRLVEAFRELDTKYNGYLFKPHPLSEALTVDGQLLSDFVRSLYTPEGPYCFDRIGDDILGIIYERFLGRVITVDHGRVSAEQKPEVRHAGGVYYTPRFVVDSIIRRVIGPKIEGKSPREVLKVKVLDPACGSGSFLIAALEFLMRHCANYFRDNPNEAEESQVVNGRRERVRLAFKAPDGDWHLSTEFRAKLLTSCIHGIDIDQQAVEVTVMSLYIKMLEGKLPQQQFLRERMLPPLDNNIRCGNSLIDPQELEDHLDNLHGELFAELTDDEKFRINPFDWKSETKGFGRVFADAQGFDCIIGNPPYIRVQELNQWAPTECEFYKTRFKSCERGNFDIYVAFLERGLELLAPAGLLGFICPHKFWQATYGAGIRKLIAQGKHLRSVVDFGDQQVFEGASTYTAIQILSKNANAGNVRYARVNELSDGPAQCVALDAGKTPEGTASFAAERPATEEPWRFEDRATRDRFNAIREAAPQTLGDVADRMFQGVRTSMNDVYVLSTEGERAGFYYSPHLGEPVKLEAAVLRRFLSGNDMRRYELVPPTSVLLLPYSVTREGAELIPSARFRGEFPHAWAYLERCKDVLRAREDGRHDNENWYGFGRTQNLDLFEKPRLIVGDLILQSSFALDTEGEFGFVSGYGVTLRTEFAEHLELLLGLLNSELLSDFLKGVSTTLRGGWFRTFPQFLKQIPIKLPRTTAEKRLAERIAAGASAITAAKKRLRTANLGDNQRVRLEREVETQDSQINRLVCQLYGVDPPE
ncbi:MAG: Type IIS restriction enzyme Eco57I [Planctomycetes bacterium]|nr:Type IIS restriction enzyme Eco57I [Planctomycetota bacterium]